MQRAKLMERAPLERAAMRRRNEFSNHPIEALTEIRVVEPGIASMGVARKQPSSFKRVCASGMHHMLNLLISTRTHATQAHR